MGLEHAQKEVDILQGSHEELVAEAAAANAQAEQWRTLLERKGQADLVAADVDDMLWKPKHDTAVNQLHITSTQLTQIRNAFENLLQEHLSLKAKSQRRTNIEPEALRAAVDAYSIQKKRKKTKQSRQSRGGRGVRKNGGRKKGKRKKGKQMDRATLIHQYGEARERLSKSRKVQMTVHVTDFIHVGVAHDMRGAEGSARPSWMRKSDTQVLACDAVVVSPLPVPCRVHFNQPPTAWNPSGLRRL